MLYDHLGESLNDEALLADVRAAAVSVTRVLKTPLIPVVMHRGKHNIGLAGTVAEPFVWFDPDYIRLQLRKHSRDPREDAALLCFILGHEVGHYMIAREEGLLYENSARNEHLADEYGLTAVRRLGLPPEPAFRSLRYFGGAEDGRHPSGDDRERRARAVWEGLS